MFRRLIPLRVQWVNQATVNMARAPELPDLVARSAARVLSTGFESLSEGVETGVGGASWHGSLICRAQVARMYCSAAG
jgi:hypothetical protein